MEITDLEKPFLEEFNKGGVYLQCGVRYSGKSLFASSLIRHLLVTDQFDRYELVIPTYSFQAKDTYAWVEQLDKKIQDKITVYESFSLQIVEDIMRQARKDDKRTFYYMDDATSIGELFSLYSTEFKDLTTKARHYRTVLWLAIHHVKGVLTPQIRSSISFYCVHRLPDSSLLETIWQENLSLFYEKKDWLQMCREEMKKDFPLIVIHRDKAGGVDNTGMDWKFIAKQRLLILKSMDSSIAKKNTKKKNVGKSKVRSSTVQDDGAEQKSKPFGVQPPVEEDEGPQVPSKEPGRGRKHPSIPSFRR